MDVGEGVRVRGRERRSEHQLVAVFIAVTTQRFFWCRLPLITRGFPSFGIVARGVGGFHGDAVDPAHLVNDVVGVVVDGVVGGVRLTGFKHV